MLHMLNNVANGLFNAIIGILLLVVFFYKVIKEKFA
jgi:hypothetical protein